MAFLPTTRQEMLALGWDRPDVVVVTGDAYVDHPSFGHAIIARVLEDAGYRVCVLAQPDPKNAAAFQRFGAPRLCFMVAAGNIDSMVNHYTSLKRPRSVDVYSPGGQAGLRPDRATIVYCNRIHEAFGRAVPIIIGGIEASLRRFAHYDYWDNKVRHSILSDCGAQLLSYGMAETQSVEIVRRLERGDSLEGIPGTCYLADSAPEDALLLPSFTQVQTSKEQYNKAFKLQYEEQDPIRGRTLAQPHEKKVLVAMPPAMPLSREELDRVYALPFERRWHPSYDALGGVPALQEVEFSISATRGCFGACNFCALTFHQGRIVQSRSEESIIKEASCLTKQKGFKGYIHDVGGPTANFRFPACKKQLKLGSCKHRQCLTPTPCKHLIVDQSEFTRLLKRMRGIKGIKKVFVRSGLRFDYMMLDQDDSFMQELLEHHVSGQLKVAPEHVSKDVLRLMGKPGCAVYDGFVARFKAMNQRLQKDQYLVPYFISAHPGSGLDEAIELAQYLNRIGHQPEQVQDFYPTPGTLSTAMWYTGVHPLTGEKIYVPRSQNEKIMQRALLQFKNPMNYAIVRKALLSAGRGDLIGFGRECLIPPRNIRAGKEAAKPQKGGKGAKQAPGEQPKRGRRPTKKRPR